MSKINRALISVYDTTGLSELVSFLGKKGVEIIASSAMQKMLEKNGVKSVESFTAPGIPDLFGGELKAVQPAILASVMANPEDQQEMDQTAAIGGKSVDLLIVNHTPLEQAEPSAKSKSPKSDITLDIGCTTLIRAAARRNESIVILSNPNQYQEFKDSFSQNDGKLPNALKQKFSLAAFELAAEMDIKLFDHFQKKNFGGDFLPDTFFQRMKRISNLKYGENPHQKAAFFTTGETNGVSLNDLEHLQGPEMSYNNLNDINTAIEIALEFDREVAVVVKHGNPIGVALDKEVYKAYLAARDVDKVSAFGSVVAFNCQVDKKTAKEIESAYTEVIVAPKFTDGALELLKASKKTANMRIFRMNSKKLVKQNGTLDMRSVLGGVLVQEKDDPLVPAGGNIKIVSKRKPTRRQLADLVMAWKICKYVRSNAIVIVKDGKTLGIGAGQMSRLDSMKIAIEKSGEEVVGAVMASDAFFPFRDVIDEAAQSGISAIIQPGGARRDDEIILACDEHNIALCLSGMRHFKH